MKILFYMHVHTGHLPTEHSVSILVGTRPTYTWQCKGNDLSPKYYIQWQYLVGIFKSTVSCVTLMQVNVTLLSLDMIVPFHVKNVKFNGDFC